MPSNFSATSLMDTAIQFWSFTLGLTILNFHSVAIKDTLSNVRFLAKFDLSGRISDKTCLNCFTIKHFLNIIICTSGVNLHAAIVASMLDKNTCIYKPCMIH